MQVVNGDVFFSFFGYIYLFIFVREEFSLFIGGCKLELCRDVMYI